jgi:hypothetical protein
MPATDKNVQRAFEAFNGAEPATWTLPSSSVPSWAFSGKARLLDQHWRQYAIVRVEVKYKNA